MSKNTVVTEEATARSFRKAIGAKIRTGAARTKVLAKTAWAWNMKVARGARKVAATVVLGGLALAGRGVYATARHTMAIGLTLVKAAMSVVLAVLLVVVIVVALVLTAVYNALRIVAFALVKLVHFVTLLLASPWLAYAGGREALGLDWEIFLVGLKPKNWFVVDPLALQVHTLKGRAKKADLEEALRPYTPKPQEPAPAQHDGQAPRPAPRHRTEPKGHPTPRQHKRRPRKLGPDTVPV